MKILFLGDVVGVSGRSMILNNILSKKKKIIKIGLAFSIQRIDKVPINMYDQKLDYIITNKYIIK